MWCATSPTSSATSGSTSACCCSFPKEGPKEGLKTGLKTDTGLNERPETRLLAGRVRQRWLEEPADLVRLRRLHPAADEELLLRLPAEFDRQFAGREMEAGAILEKFDDTLSNAVQLAPSEGAPLARPRCRARAPFPRTGRAPARGAPRAGGNPHAQRRARPGRGFFRSEKILRLMQRGVRVEEFTAPGDPMRIDFSYRRNGTRGFVQSVALGRDPGQAKLLAYTAGAIREHVKHSEFLAVTEREPARGNPRDRFVSEIFKEGGIQVVPLGDLRKWAHDVAPVLRAEVP